MHFLYPNFLYALSLLSIPVIIHLFNFRRFKKLYFTNVKFLSVITQEQKSKNKLKQYILLALRLLGLTALICAFAYPFNPKNANSQKISNKVAIYLDNSFSMACSAEGEAGNLLHQAKIKADEVINSYPDGTKFILFTNDLDLKYKRWVDKKEVRSFINEVELTPEAQNFSVIQKRLQAEIGNDEFIDEYYISDFQSYNNEITQSPFIQLKLVPLQSSKISNLYIDSAWFENSILQSGTSSELFIKLKNSSNDPVSDNSVRLTVNNVQKGMANFSLNAQGESIIKMNFTISDTGYNYGQLSINDNPITFDDKYYFSFRSIKSIPILLISQSDQTSAVEKALSKETNFQITKVLENQIDFSSLGSFRFIIINELEDLSTGLASALKEYINSGGHLLFIPSADNLKRDQNNTFLEKLDDISLVTLMDHPSSLKNLDASKSFYTKTFEEVSSNIQMPNVSKYYKINGTGLSSLIEFSNGDGFLMTKRSGEGNIYVLSVPLSQPWSNFTQHGLFLPSLYRMVFFSSINDRIAYTIGTDNYIDVPKDVRLNDGMVKLVKDSFEIIPPQKSIEGKMKLFVEGLIRTSGTYKLILDKGLISLYSFNYNRKESQMNFKSLDSLQRIASDHIQVYDGKGKPMNAQINEMQSGVYFWKWFVFFALIMFLAESIIGRVWK